MAHGKELSEELILNAVNVLCFSILEKSHKSLLQKSFWRMDGPFGLTETSITTASIQTRLIQTSKGGCFVRIG